jgi:hypothetical protein
MPRDAGLENKVYKLPGGQEFKEEVDAQTITVLEGRITQMQKDLDESEEHKKNNEALIKVKNEKAELEGPYNDFKKAVQVKTKYIIELIKEKGGE